MAFRIEPEKDYGFLLKSLIAGGELNISFNKMSLNNNNAFLFNYYSFRAKYYVNHLLSTIIINCSTEQFHIYDNICVIIIIKER